MRMNRLLGCFVLALGSACAQTTPPGGDAAAMPDGPGKVVVLRACASCHAVTVVTSKRTTHKEWDQVVNLMVSRGAELSDEEIDTVIDYLAKNYGPLDQKTPPASDAPATSPAPDAGTTSTVNVNTASAKDIESSLRLATPEAEALVKYRTQHGDFKTWQELAAVPGVPAAKIEAMQKRLAF